MKTFRTLIVFFIFIVGAQIARADTVYQAPKDFLDEIFSGDPPEPETLSIFGDRRKTITAILSHPPAMLRVRYWRKEKQTAWILEEIGKTKPITVGLVVKASELHDVRVLIYRESHGAEVRHRFFTRQFRNARLSPEMKLSKSIDGISGATLSVSALRRLASLALFLNEEVSKG